MFGFTLGSDTDEAGTKTVAVETVGRLGKRRGTYTGLGQKLEVGYGISDDLNASLSLLGDYHRVRSVPDLDDVRARYGFSGVGGEIRWRILRRSDGPFGMTLHLEPSMARFDEVSGQRGRKLGSENKLIFDKELVTDTLFGAVNLLYDVERFRERRSGEVERASGAGAAAALSYQMLPELFVGGEVRYLRAYDGLALQRYRGDAVYVGPTLFARLPRNAWISASWNVQIAGGERLDRAGIAAALEGQDLEAATLMARRRRLNLADFDRHQFRLKIGVEF